MDIYLFGFITLAIGSLVVAVLVMYQHSHQLRSTVVDLEDELNDMYECHVSESNPWELADELSSELQSTQSRLELSETMRKIQRDHIKDLGHELSEIEDQLKTLSL